MGKKIIILRPGVQFEVSESDASAVSMQNYMKHNFNDGSVVNPRQISFIGDHSVIDAGVHPWDAVLDCGVSISVCVSDANAMKNRLGDEFPMYLSDGSGVINCGHVVMIAPSVSFKDTPEDKVSQFPESEYLKEQIQDIGQEDSSLKKPKKSAKANNK